MTRVYKSPEGEREVREWYLEILKRWPAPNQHLRLPTRQGETFVVACGDENAPPLLLFHGTGANSSTWIGDVAAWAEHFRVYAVDMIGEPGLSAPSRPPLSSDAHMLWLDDVLRGLSLTRVSIVGLSLGGWLTLDYATRRPERVERLVLLCPAGVGAVLVKNTLFRSLVRSGRRRLREMIHGRTPSIASAPTSVIGANFNPRVVKIPTFSDRALRRLTMPVMAILGGKDVVLDSAGTRRRLERNVPHAEICYLPEAGHAIPEQTVPILEFLGRNHALQMSKAPPSGLRS